MYTFANLLLLNFKLIFLKFSLDFRSVTASFCFGDLKSLEQPRQSFESITNARRIAISFWLVTAVLFLRLIPLSTSVTLGREPLVVSVATIYNGRPPKWVLLGISITILHLENEPPRVHGQYRRKRSSSSRGLAEFHGHPITGRGITGRSTFGSALRRAAFRQSSVNWENHHVVVDTNEAESFFFGWRTVRRDPVKSHQLRDGRQSFRIFPRLNEIHWLILRTNCHQVLAIHSPALECSVVSSSFKEVSTGRTSWHLDYFQSQLTTKCIGK